MEITIRKLTSALLGDWLSYFDRDAFSDNADWCGCYCMCYHWNDELNSKRPWNCDTASAAFNREQAILFIRQNRLQGYMAYCDGRVVAWCNANEKSAYDNVHFSFAKYIPDNGEKIKSIGCFSVAPAYRGQGIATALLHYVYEDAKADGFDLVEAYPFAHNENHAYHGAVSMYEKCGFTYQDTIEGCKVYRKNC